MICIQYDQEPDILESVSNIMLTVGNLDKAEIAVVITLKGSWTHPILKQMAQQEMVGKTDGGTDTFIGGRWVGQCRGVGGRLSYGSFLGRVVRVGNGCGSAVLPVHTGTGRG